MINSIQSVNNNAYKPNFGMALKFENDAAKTLFTDCVQDIFRAQDYGEIAGPKIAKMGKKLIKNIERAKTNNFDTLFKEDAAVVNFKDNGEVLANIASRGQSSGGILETVIEALESANKQHMQNEKRMLYFKKMGDTILNSISK